MPQLDTSNWLPMLLLIWLTMIMMMTKISNTNLLMSPKKLKKSTKATKWAWPW